MKISLLSFLLIGLLATPSVTAAGSTVITWEHTVGTYSLLGGEVNRPTTNFTIMDRPHSGTIVRSNVTFVVDAVFEIIGATTASTQSQPRFTFNESNVWAHDPSGFSGFAQCALHFQRSAGDTERDYDYVRFECPFRPDRLPAPGTRNNFSLSDMDASTPNAVVGGRIHVKLVFQDVIGASMGEILEALAIMIPLGFLLAMAVWAERSGSLIIYLFAVVTGAFVTLNFWQEIEWARVLVLGTTVLIAARGYSEYKDEEPIE